MDEITRLGRFAVNANLDELRDVFELDDILDEMFDILWDVDGVPPDMWLAMDSLRNRIDVMKWRGMVVPGHIKTNFMPSDDEEAIVPIPLISN